MFYPPETILALAASRRQELIAEADRQRLLRLAHRGRRNQARREARHEPLNRGRPAGTLAGCGPGAAVPAR